MPHRGATTGALCPDERVERQGFICIDALRHGLPALHWQIAIGMVGGALVGGALELLAPGFADDFSRLMEPIGLAFVRLVTMAAAPLVLASLVIGVSSVADPAKLGRIGGKTLGLYVLTTALAITTGVLLAVLIQPGSSLTAESAASLREGFAAGAEARLGQATQTDFRSWVISLIPSNPFTALADGLMLQVVVFALLLGLALALIPRERAEPVVSVFGSFNDAMIKVVELVMRLAPIGVFALVAATTAGFGFGVLAALGTYTLVVVLGLAVHIFAVYGPLVHWLSRGAMPIRRFYKSMTSVQLLAFSTSSSAATLPLNMETVRDRLGASDRVTAFVLPLGATVNMDGTALYQGVAAVFIAQVYGLALSPADLGTIVLTATLASIGTAAVPGAGLIMLVIVLQAVGIPPEGIALILGVDRLLDMCRTVVNVTGDAAVAVVVASSEGELGEPRATFLSEIPVVEPGSAVGG